MKALGLGEHPHVLEHIGAYSDPARPQYTYVVSPFCGKGSLDNVVSAALDNRKFLTTTVIGRAFIQCCLGVRHLHSKGTVHGDLKPENVFIHNYDNGRAVVADIAGKGESTTCYKAPEQFQNRPETWTEKCDVWGLGVILHYICTNGKQFF